MKFLFFFFLDDCMMATSDGREWLLQFISATFSKFGLSLGIGVRMVAISKNPNFFGSELKFAILAMRQTSKSGFFHGFLTRLVLYFIF